MIRMIIAQSKRRIRRKKCTGKRGYDEMSKANAVAKRMIAQGEGKLQSYKCSFCGQWHVGHRNHE